MREVPFTVGERYHVWNRGIDKRVIFNNTEDIDRFMLGIEQFNTLEVIGELGRGHRVSTDPKLVEIIAYCLNTNHFHLILEQTAEKGIEKFMHKLCMGYSKYFNTKYKRSGSLFGGKFKAKHIDSNEYLLHLSAYVNLNYLAHGRGHRVSTLGRSSWSEYVLALPEELCNKSIILEQFESKEQYKKFAEDALKDISSRKALMSDLESLGLELVKS